ncbi:MAG: nucleotidyltransferase family protein [Acidobacteriota bacterium]
MPSKPLADPMLIPVILLAAGGSTRLGQPKQLLRLPSFGGATLLDHSVQQVQGAGAAPIFVILGAHADDILLDCALLDCILIRNEAWAEGMASSLRAGIAAVMENAPSAPGAMLLVCDQPGLSAEHLRCLLDAYAADPGRIAASKYAGRLGVPAIFPRASFPALLRLDGDQGARALLRQAGVNIHAIDFPGGELDLDSPADVERLKMNAACESSKNLS